MADIDVVPKNKSMAWVWWVVAIVVILAVLWWAFGGRSANQTGRFIQDDAPLQVAALVDAGAGAGVVVHA